MAKYEKKMAQSGCCGCGWDVETCGGLTKTPDGWKCDECIRQEAELGELDIEEWDEKRRQRLAEQQEY